MSFADWSASAAPAIFWRYHAPPLKGPMLLAGSRTLLLQLVDIFYGGRGQLAAEREELTDAEDRFAARLGRDIGLQLAAAWRPYIETCVEAFGASRCMFESNFPVDKGSYGYAVCWNAFKRLAAGAGAAEKAALFAGTAARFYRLPVGAA